MKPTSPPSGPATQDAPPTNATTVAPSEAKGWKTVEGKVTKRKKRTEEADKKWAIEMSNKPLMMKNSRQGENSHQV
jgi:hypothetical protein